jgi:hypothetical protein
MVYLGMILHESSNACLNMVETLPDPDNDDLKAFPNKEIAGPKFLVTEWDVNWASSP